MKFVLLIICLFFVRVLPAQKPVTIECRIGEGIGKIMQLSGVNNGQLYRSLFSIIYEVHSQSYPVKKDQKDEEREIPRYYHL